MKATLAATAISTSGHEDDSPQQAARIPTETELRSSKEIVATFGWLEDLPMVLDPQGNVNRLHLFFLFHFVFFMSTLLFLLVQLANAYGWLGTTAFMN